MVKKMKNQATNKKNSDSKKLTFPNLRDGKRS